MLTFVQDDTRREKKAKGLVDEFYEKALEENEGDEEAEENETSEEENESEEEEALKENRGWGKEWDDEEEEEKETNEDNESNNNKANEDPTEPAHRYPSSRRSSPRTTSTTSYDKEEAEIM